MKEYNSNILELNEEYKNIIEDNRQECYKSGQEVLDYILNSTAKYHGRCVRALYMPKLFTDKDIEYFEAVITELYEIFDIIFKEYIENKEYRKLFGFSKELEELMLRKPLYKCNVPISRIDLFLNETTGEFKFCEFNTDGSSAMNEDRELNIAATRSYAYKKFAQKYKLSTFELFDSWVNAVKVIYSTYKKRKDNPHVAIVDFMESATSNEFLIFAEHFEKNGMTCEVCEIRDLKYNGKKLISPTGKEIDIIYRRAVTSDIMSNYVDVAEFIAAVKDENVCLIGDFRTQIVHNKVLFKVLHDDMTMQLLSENQRKYIKAHVPYTVSLKSGKFDYEQVISNKDKWLIKPEDLYGSKGLCAGVECENTEQWKKAIDNNINKDYLLQEFCIPYKTTNIDLMYDENAEFRGYSNLTGLFVYNGKLSGVYSRTSNSDIISTQYSEMSLPTVIVSTK